MKKILLVVTILCLYGQSQADWDNIVGLPSRIDERVYEKIYFIDTLQGWILGGNFDRTTPYLAKSVNGGNSWTTSRSVDSRLAYIWDIYFVDENVGWMVGEAKQTYMDSTGLIYKTEDGGSSWQLVLEGKHIYRPRKIVFPTASTGYFFASPITWTYPIGSDVLYGTIGRTTDGGNTWHIDSLDGFEKKYFLNAYFLNADTGWVVGGYKNIGARLDTPTGFIMQTVDGGVSWQSKPIADINADELMTVYFTDNKKGWIGGSKIIDRYNETQLLAYTEDGGNTWIVPMDFQNNRSGKVHNVHFFNNLTGWVVEDHGLYHTQNGGMDWEMTRFDENGNDGVSNSYFFDSSYAWLVILFNDYFRLYRTKDGGGYSQVANTVVPSLRPNVQSLQPFNIKVSSALNGMVNINYRLDKDASMSLSVYNLKGNKIAFQPQRFYILGEHKFSVKIPKGFYIVEAKIYNGTKENNFTQKIFVR